MAVENIVGKEENAGNQYFLLFQQCFLTSPNQISIFHFHLFLLSANAFNLDKSKILSFGNGLRWNDDYHFDRICSFLTADCYINNGYEGKQSLAWRENCAEYWLKRNSRQASENGCTGFHNITEIMLKMALNTIQSINHNVIYLFNNKISYHAKYIVLCNVYVW